MIHAKYYSKFTTDDLAELGIKPRTRAIFSADIQPIEPTELLKKILEMNMRLPLTTEKAKSEGIIFPILNELRVNNEERFVFFSGYTFNIDSKLGLKGSCDFLLSRQEPSPVIEAPVFCVVEAKNDNVDNGIAQCGAEMFAARLFNQQKNNVVGPIYGAVSSGLQWLFLRLDGHELSIDSRIIPLDNLPELLGVLQAVLDAHKI